MYRSSSYTWYMHQWVLQTYRTKFWSAIIFFME